MPFFCFEQIKPKSEGFLRRSRCSLVGSAFASSASAATVVVAAAAAAVYYYNAGPAGCYLLFSSHCFKIVMMRVYRDVCCCCCCCCFCW